MAEELEVTNNRVLKIWWALIWRGILFGALAGALAGALVGFIIGFIGGVTNNPTLVHDAAPLFSLLGAIVGLVVGFYILKLILKKKFKGFRIALIKTD